MENNKEFRLGTFLCIAMLLFSFALICVPSTSEAAGLSSDWVAETPMGDARSQAVVVDDGNGIAYIIGGSSEIPMGAVDNVSSYNLETGAWTGLEPLPIAVRGASGVYHEGKIYVFSGAIEPTGTTNATQIYDVTTDAWAQGAPMPASTWESKAVADDDGHIYVVGGEGNPDGILIYNIETDSWTSGSSAPGDMLAGAVYIDGSYLYYVGGASDIIYDALDTVYEYRMSSDYWVTEDPLPEAVAASTGILGDDDVFYLLGGANNAYNYGSVNYNVTYYYNEVDDQWETFDPLPIEVRYASSVFHDGKLFLIGGNNGTEAFDSVYSYKLYELEVELDKTTVGQGETLGATITVQHALFDIQYAASGINIVGPTGITFPMGDFWFDMMTDSAGFEITIPESADPGEYTFTLYFDASFDKAYSYFPYMNETFTVVSAPSMQERIDQLQTLLNTTFTGIMDNLTQMQSDLDSMQSNLTQMQGDLNSMQSDLDSMEDQLNTMSDQVSSAEQKVSDMSMFMYLIIVLLIIVLVILVVVMIKK